MEHIVEYLGFGFPATTTLLIFFIVFGFPGNKIGYEINVHWITLSTFLGIRKRQTIEPLNYRCY